MKSKIQILIIEDEAIIAENLRYSLEDLGYEVTATCYTFDEAIAAVTHQQLDIVMLDINLGEADETRNGLRIAEIINEQYHIPFIFITAYNDLETIRTAAKLQPYGYLIKPLNNSILFATVQLAIERFTNKTVATKPDNEHEKPGYFFVKIGIKTLKVSWADVYCLEAGKNYVKLRSISNGLDYPIRGSLAYVINNLMPSAISTEFIRINRSNYLNTRYITGYDNNYVYCGTEKFENGKSNLQQLKKIFISNNNN